MKDNLTKPTNLRDTFEALMTKVQEDLKASLETNSSKSPFELETTKPTVGSILKYANSQLKDLINGNPEPGTGLKILMQSTQKLFIEASKDKDLKKKRAIIEKTLNNAQKELAKIPTTKEQEKSKDVVKPEPEVKLTSQEKLKLAKDLEQERLKKVVEDVKEANKTNSVESYAYGPLNKSVETKKFEEIVRAVIDDRENESARKYDEIRKVPNSKLLNEIPEKAPKSDPEYKPKIRLYTENNQLWAERLDKNGEKINMSELMKNVNMNHVSLTDTALKKYENLYENNINSDAPSREDFKEKLEKSNSSQKEDLKQLSHAEMIAINDYTSDSGYKDMNGLLRGTMIPEDPAKTLMDIAISSQGLNKIPDIDLPVVSRYQNTFELKKMQEMANKGEVEEVSGFISTSLKQTKTTEKRFYGGVEIIYENVRGKDISALTSSGGENEYLIPPSTQIRYTGFRGIDTTVNGEKKTKYIFTAKGANVLLAKHPKVSDPEIKNQVNQTTNIVPETPKQQVNQPTTAPQVNAPTPGVELTQKTDDHRESVEGVLLHPNSPNESVIKKDTPLKQAPIQLQQSQTQTKSIPINILTPPNLKEEQKPFEREETKQEELSHDSFSNTIQKHDQSIDAPEQTTSSPQELDEITAAIRAEILEKQHALLVSAVAGATEDEEAKAQIGEMNPHELREYLASPEGREVTEKVLNDKELHKKLNEIEVAGYKEVHTRFQESFKNVEWVLGEDGTNSTQIKNEQGQLVAEIKETTHNREPINVKLADGTTKTVSSYRTIDFPKELESGNGPLHMSMAVKDENGKNIAENAAVYFTAHYDNSGKLTEVSSPQPVKFAAGGDDAIGYIERDGKVFTLPVTRGKYNEMMLEVAKNQGLEVDLSQKLELGQDKFQTKEVEGKEKETHQKLEETKIEKKEDIQPKLTTELEYNPKAIKGQNVLGQKKFERAMKNKKKLEGQEVKPIQTKHEKDHLLAKQDNELSERIIQRKTEEAIVLKNKNQLQSVGKVSPLLKKLQKKKLAQKSKEEIKKGPSELEKKGIIGANLPEVTKERQLEKKLEKNPKKTELPSTKDPSTKKPEREKKIEGTQDKTLEKTQDKKIEPTKDDTANSIIATLQKQNTTPVPKQTSVELQRQAKDEKIIEKNGLIKPKSGMGSRGG